MTATREKERAPHPDSGAPHWSEHSAFGTRGVPLWAAVLIAGVPTAVGTLLDLLIWSKPDLLFKSCFFIGAVLAVTLVQRRNVFGPMVQAPLVLAVVMPVIVLIAGTGGGSGLTGKILGIVNPLISSFPIMAATAGVTLGIGLVRIFVTQRASDQEDEAPPRKRRPSDSERRQRPERKQRPERQRPARGERQRPEREGRDAPPRKRPRDTGANRAQPPEDRAAGRPQRGRPAAPADTGRNRAQSPGRPRGGDVPGRGRGDAPGRPRAGEGRPERAVPPRRGAPAPRQAPGRPRPPEQQPPAAQPPRRPRRPR